MNCLIIDPCLQPKCGAYEICTSKLDGSYICNCPTCSNEYSFVCSSNGQTFGSECQLRRFQCLQKVEENMMITKKQHCGMFLRCSFFLLLDCYHTIEEYLIHITLKTVIFQEYLLLF